MSKFMEQVVQSKHFTKWIDPASGVVSYILTSDIIPHTQSFYFTNRSITNDGRYLWVYCAFPPAGDANYGRSLAVVDLEKDTFTHFPETEFLDASPLIDLDDGTAYWCNKSGPYINAGRTKRTRRSASRRFRRFCAGRGRCPALRRI